MPQTKPSSFRLSEDARRILAAIAKRLGIKRTAVLEILIRENEDRGERPKPKGKPR